MEQIINVKDYFDSPQLLKILAGCVYNPTAERLKRRAEKYMKSLQTSIYALKQDDEYVGLIVLGTGDPKQIEILDFAVREGMQKKGVGSQLIKYCSTLFPADSIIAETDDDAVGFYEKVGFTVQPLGDKYGVGIDIYFCKIIN